jgi:hypothetical protein
MKQLNARQIQIAKAVLKALDDADRQLAENIIHADVNAIIGEHVALAELKATIVLCDTEGWLIGVPTRFHGKLWKISDAGRAALLEMA